MSGYVSGYLVTKNRNVSGFISNGELSVTTINGVPVLIPNNAVELSPGDVFPKYGSGGGVGQWWDPTGNTNNNNDTNSSYRTQVAQTYVSLFGRYPGQIAVENWVYYFLYHNNAEGQRLFGTILNMISSSQGTTSERSSVFYPYDIGFTLNAPKFACTDSTASNYAGASSVGSGQIYGPTVLIPDNTLCTYPITPTVSLTASPTEILNDNKSSSTLTWSTTNATSASVVDNFGSSIGITTFGTKSVTPTQSTSYTLSATSSTNTTATTSAIVTVRNLPTGTITLSPSSIKSGDTATLTWSTSNALSASVVDNLGNSIGSGLSGSRSISSFGIKTEEVPGYNGPGIYLDLRSETGTVDVTISTVDGFGPLRNTINIPGVANISDNQQNLSPALPTSKIYSLSGGRIYGPCTVDHQDFTTTSGRNLYIGSDIIGTALPQYANNMSLAVTEYDKNLVSFYPFGLLMYLFVDRGSFVYLSSAPLISVPNSPIYTLTVNGYLNSSYSTSTTLNVEPPKRPYAKYKNTWRKVNNIYVKFSDEWIVANYAYIKENGNWRHIFK
jgi:hypothetical protein